MIYNTIEIHNERLTTTQKIALYVTRKIGNFQFFLAIVLWTTSWLLWNSIGPKEYRFDPFPAFVLWLFISNAIQLFLMPLVLTAQTLDAKHEEIKAQQNHKILVSHDKLLKDILAHLNKDDMS